MGVSVSRSSKQGQNPSRAPRRSKTCLVGADPYEVEELQNALTELEHYRGKTALLPLLGEGDELLRKLSKEKLSSELVTVAAFSDASTTASKGSRASSPSIFGDISPASARALTRRRTL